MKLIKKINGNIMKVIILYILAAAVVMAIYFIEKKTIYTESTNNANAQIQSLQTSVIEQMTIIDELYHAKVTSSMKTLVRNGTGYGLPEASGSVDFKGHDVPELKLGNTSVIGTYELVDMLTEDMGGTATLFVKAVNGDYVRVSTNVKKADGSRAVGTILTKGGNVEQLINRGRPYYGIVDILGNPYFTGYEPMLDANGEKVGIWYVGYSLDHMSSLGESITGKKVFENDLSIILDGKDRIIAKSEDIPDEEILSLVSGVDDNDEWIKTTKDFENWGYRVVSLYKTEDIDKSAHAKSLRQLLKIGIIFVMFSLFIIYFVIATNRTNKKISDAAVKLSGFTKLVNASSHGLSEASHQLSQGSAEQAAAIEETSATMDETSSMVRRNASNAGEANSLSSEALSAAENGAQKVRMMSESMDDLKKSSTDIARIIKVIDDIAFQTNILALNAAVEAARAGDAGLGFAVVADEVRNLAQKSAGAAKDTSDIIDKNISLSERGVLISSEVEGALSEIKERVEKVNQLISEVTIASTEQAKGVEQVTGAIGQMEKVVQSTAASAEETNASAEELQKQASELAQVVKELNKLVKGGKEKSTYSDEGYSSADESDGGDDRLGLT